MGPSPTVSQHRMRMRRENHLPKMKLFTRLAGSQPNRVSSQRQPNAACAGHLSRRSKQRNNALLHSCCLTIRFLVSKYTLGLGIIVVLLSQCARIIPVLTRTACFPFLLTTVVTLRSSLIPFFHVHHENRHCGVGIQKVVAVLQCLQ